MSNLLRSTSIASTLFSTRTAAAASSSSSFRVFPSISRHFSRTAPIMVVKAGDSIPSTTLFENSPGNKVDLSKELESGKGLIIGVPAAFSPGCSETHVPGYLASEKTKSAGKVFVVSVNDAFVMKAWGKNLDPSGDSPIRWIADPAGKFVHELELDFDATPVLGNFRAKRFALVTEDGKVKSVHVEPDNTGVDVSSVDKVLA